MTGPYVAVDDPPPLCQAQMEAAATWLVRLRDDDDDHVLNEFSAWLAEDPTNEAAFQQAEVVFAGLGGPLGTVSRQPAQRHLHLGWKVAAAFFLAVAVGWFGRNLPVDLSADLTTRAGETETRLLADGTHVTLNTHSAVRFVLDADRRRVFLDRGEAFFDVAHEPQRPFIVSAGKVRVTVTGTRFNVRRLADGATVAVSEGQVKVAVEDGSVITLAPGQSVRFGADGVKRGSVDIAAVATWREGRAAFVNAKLSDVANEMSRYRSAPVLILDAAAGEQPLSAVLETRDTVKSLQTAAAAVGAQATRLPGGIVIIH